jgi:hypothetical protein
MEEAKRVAKQIAWAAHIPPQLARKALYKGLNSPVARQILFDQLSDSIGIIAVVKNMFRFLDIKRSLFFLVVPPIPSRPYRGSGPPLKCPRIWPSWSRRNHMIKGSKDNMEIKRVGVVGCGLMRSGIAQVCAQSDYEVTVLEAN